MTSERNVTGLGELEAAVLEAVWEAGQATVPQLFSVVGAPKGLAYTTILTVVQRLTKKRLLVRDETGRRHGYRAALHRDEFSRQRAQELAGILVELGGAGAAAFVAEAQRLDPEWVAGLRERLGREEGS